MAFLIEDNRCTSPTSSAQVSAVIGPTAGIVINRSTRSTNNESRSRERTRALSVFPSRTTVSRHSRSSEPSPSSMSGLQFAEVAGLVQALLVVAHSRFHQQRADLDFHLHHLPNQQVAVAQRTPSFTNRRRGHAALGKKIATQQSQILLASMRSFFFLAAAIARSISGCATCRAAACGLS